MNCISFNTLTSGFEDDLDCGLGGVPSLSTIDCAPISVNDVWCGSLYMRILKQH